MNMKNWIVVDVEADNSSPATGSMVCFGAVSVVDPSITFYGETKPITSEYNEETLAISGFTRAEHEKFPDPRLMVEGFDVWVHNIVKDQRATLWSDNPAFDWQWINYYFDQYLGYNPFGFSARRIGDLYCGLVKNVRANRDWKRKYRKTKHDHNPVNDAKGNAEAILAIVKEFNL